MKESAKKGFEFYQMLQCDDGHWAGDYGGPMFLMPGLIIVLYITKSSLSLSNSRKDAMITYLQNHQQIDGGWATHIEGASTMFGTVLSYVSLRLLGESPTVGYMREARSFIMLYGGVLYAPSWAKFWLAVLGVYDWKGINSVPAEMWMLPRWFPFHPGRMWCHSRMVYLPMCYLYGKRYSADISKDPLLQQLRIELYTQGTNYDHINWDKYRQTCADIDVYSALNPVMKVAQDLLSYYEYILPYLPPLSYIREVGLQFAIQYIKTEDIQTNYIDIGPVNKSLNMLSVWVASGQDSLSSSFLNHLIRVDDYLWVAEDGMKMQGYCGSQCWDTCFAIQALVEAELCTEFPTVVNKVYNFLARTQIQDDERERERWFRQVSKGGWPFSTAAHGWPISDCTAEGLKSVLYLHSLSLSLSDTTPMIPLSSRISSLSLSHAVDVILSLHNTDGGWATYENNRGYGWYELLNPSEVFGDIMIDYSYVECSSACVQALVGYQQSGSEYRADEITYAIAQGINFIKSIQREDGSWYGSWGVCFTYGTWFGVVGLITAGVSREEECIRRAINWLLETQRENGGWGESYVACVDKYYSEEGTGTHLGDRGSGIVQTSWALLTILSVQDNLGQSVTGCTRERSAAYRAAIYLRSKQLPSGDWPQEGITGVFNRSCGITYTAYRNVFPIWALGKYAKIYGESD
eukprot:CAMPEP_0182422772 /NCGR_PEP_ID=MMETSP1167-20130531/8545_1 /TAXON_ID=2988 /ORGANISM="Mallomonas Sp, Strain CCMP3275" /LENGTH=689 /DNA_ID=CAMNT_0024601113 /DNA_START=357 /DNA_END=2426 /DNA_ORIENTATION=+